jgi:hypothetical protein
MHDFFHRHEAGIVGTTGTPAPSSPRRALGLNAPAAA